MDIRRVIFMMQPKKHFHHVWMSDKACVYLLSNTNSCSLAHRWRQAEVVKAGFDTLDLKTNAEVVNARLYLLLVLPLQVQPGLDVAPGLLEGLSLGHLGRVVGADPDHVGAQEDQHVGANLHGKRQRKKNRGQIALAGVPHLLRTCHRHRNGADLWLTSLRSMSENIKALSHLPPHWEDTLKLAPLDPVVVWE